jgi:hypothetical protein
VRQVPTLFPYGRRYARDEKLAGPLAARSPGLRLALALEIQRHCSAEEILQGRLLDLVTLMDVDGAPDIPVEAGVALKDPSSLTTFLYVSPQTMPPWDHVGVPIHFHSSMISGSASCTIWRTFARVFPCQSPSSLILSSINAEAASAGMGLFMYTSDFSHLF